MTVALMEASLIWPLLAIVAVVGCLPALVVKEPQLYWLAVFLFSSALDIKKNLVDGLMIRAAFKMDYELPILVPEIRLSDLAFLMLLGLWLLRLMGRRERFLFPPVAWLILAYLGWAALSLLKAPNLYFGAVQLTREIKFFVVFLYAVNNIDSKRMVRVIAGALLAMLVLQAGLTLARYQFQFGYLGGNMFGRVVVDVASDPLLTVTDVDGKLGGGRRAFGTIGSPAGTAEHLLLLLPVALFAGFSASKFSRRVALFALCTVGTAALLVTYSRTGLNGFIVGFVLTAVLVYRRQLIERRTFGLALLFVSVAALWITPLVYSYYATRPAPVTIRFEQYWTALNMIRANPILGVGLNNSAGLQRDYNPNLSNVPLDDPTKAAYKAPIHNYFLSMTADIGIIGTALFVTFFVLICREGYRWTHSRDREITLAACAVLVGIVSLWAAVLADPLYQDGTQTLLWFFSGLTLAFGRIEGESPTPAASRRFAVPMGRMNRSYGERLLR
jgi:O-antigen ligase